MIRRHPDSNWGIKDLQSIALPLDYTAYSCYELIISNIYY